MENSASLSTNVTIDADRISSHKKRFSNSGFKSTLSHQMPRPAFDEDSLLPQRIVSFHPASVICVLLALNCTQKQSPDSPSQRVMMTGSG